MISHTRGPAVQPWKEIGRYGTVGLELVVAMGVFFFLGRWLDGKFGTKYLALIGLLLGVFAGFRNLMRAANEMQRAADREAAEELRQGEKILAAHEEKRVEDSVQITNDIRPNAKGSRDGDAPS